MKFVFIVVMVWKMKNEKWKDKKTKRWKKIKSGEEKSKKWEEGVVFYNNYKIKFINSTFCKH